MGMPIQPYLPIIGKENIKHFQRISLIINDFRYFGCELFFMFTSWFFFFSIAMSTFLRWFIRTQFQGH